MVKGEIHKKFYIKFDSFSVVDKDTIVINNTLSGDYKHLGSVSTIWEGRDITWQIFKTDSKEMVKAGFKYFLFFPFHRHSKNSLRHCHLRYGNQSFEFLSTDPSVYSWWPTIYQPAVTNEDKIIESIMKKARLQASMLPPLKRPIK